MVASVWPCGLSEQSELAAFGRAAGGGENLPQIRFLAAPLAHLGFAVMSLSQNNLDFLY
jgi:hypothetical protein